MDLSGYRRVFGTGTSIVLVTLEKCVVEWRSERVMEHCSRWRSGDWVGSIGRIDRVGQGVLCEGVFCGFWFDLNAVLEYFFLERFKFVVVAFKRDWGSEVGGFWHGNELGHCS